MKNILLIAFTLFCLLATESQAQIFAEWFQQKKTQKKYLLQQIMVLHTYKKSVKKGYALAKEGLTAIGDSKNGEFALHGEYFTSIQKATSPIRNYTRVRDIINLSARIFHSYPIALKQVQESGAFDEEEISYIHRVYARLMDACNNLIDELTTIITDGKLEMTDDERIKRIDALYREIEDQYTFLKRFRNETMVMAASRINTKSNVETSRLRHGIKDQEI
jgi:hypothetical protein